MNSSAPINLLIVHAGELLTCVPTGDDLLGRVRDGAVAVAGERIVAAGPSAAVLAQVDASAAQVVDATGKIIAPGFVDSHTHLVFGGSRVQEYAARMTRTPDQVRALGIPTGIGASVQMTRSASREQLTASALDRLGRMFRHGTTTLESKTGYGLTLADELKLLEVNRALQQAGPVDVVSTFLGAHAFPDELSHERYLDVVVEEMLPLVAERRLAEFCDVFCDEGYFSADDSRRILEAGRRAGLKPKIHADQYSSIGAAQVAVDVGAISADHLNFTEHALMRALAGAGVVGVVTPALDFAVQHPRPTDARAMFAAGMLLALATDFCPAAWVESMQVVMQLACRLYRFSPEEALYAATVGGARSLDLDDRGCIAAGKLADLQLWNLPTFEDVIYRIGNNAVEAVVKRGKLYPIA
jgi:imidazolonepropionase